MDMVLAVDPSKWTDEAFLNDLVLNCLQRRRGFWLYGGELFQLVPCLGRYSEVKNVR